MCIIKFFKHQKKNSMKLLSFAAVTLLIFTSENTLVGKWSGKPSEKGNVTSVNFKADNTLEGFVNKKPFVSGTYNFNPVDSTIFFIDNGCNGVSAVYKILFYSNSDSMRFQVISDACEERKQGMQRLVMGKVK